MDTHQGQGQHLGTEIAIEQSQRLSRLQAMAARLMELPIEALPERISLEMQENPYLEAQYEGNEDGENHDAPEPDTAPEQKESEDISPQESNGDYDDDVIPTAGSDRNAAGHEFQNTEPQTLFDILTAQTSEYDLTEHQLQIMNYLIGSLEDDGILRTSTRDIADELYIYNNVDTDEAEVNQVLMQLQCFEPAGVGARNTQECFLLQARRHYQGREREQFEQLFGTMYDDFLHQHWNRIQRRLNLTDAELLRMHRRIRKSFNPHPGGSVGSDSMGSNRSITPDFLVEIDEDNRITVTLNDRSLPQLSISPDLKEMLDSPHLGKDREFYRRYSDEGNMFITALEQRRQTMLLTIKAIINLQRDFFISGDETRLQPMRLEDVANITGQDISTVSRVSNSKYVETMHGTFPLKWFFGSSAILDGDQVTIRRIMDAIKELVENEPHEHPLDDADIERRLKERGYKVARRTVAKYRVRLGIPKASIRKRSVR